MSQSQGQIDMYPTNTIHAIHAKGVARLIKRRAFICLAMVVAAGVLAACVAPPPAASGPQIKIEGAWGRPSPKMANAGAFYMAISNSGNEADKLIAGSSPSCGTVELHESYQTADGMMGMRPVAGGSIEIPAGGQIELKVGGLHVMCIDKADDFAVGVKLPLTLTFEKSGDKTIDIEIRENQ